MALSLLRNFRYDEFLGLDLSVLIEDEVQTVPENSPYYVRLNELPRKDSPSSLTVRVGGGSSDVVTPAADCDVFEGNPDANGDTGVLHVGKDSPGFGSYRWRSFLRFDLTGLPPVADRVKFRIWREDGHSDPTIGLFKVTSPWGETEPKWHPQPTRSGAPFATFKIENAGGVGRNGWYEVDVTGQYNRWQAELDPNYGFALVSESATDTISNFTSRQGLDIHLPRLIVNGVGDAYQELARTIAPGPGQVAVSYPTGRLRFNPEDAGKPISVTYRGLGSPIDALDVVVDVPATSSSPGRYMQIAADANYLYICYAPNSWARTALSTF